MPRTWSGEEDARMTSHLPSGKGKLFSMDIYLHRVVNNFCIFNAKVTTNWVHLWTMAKARRLQKKGAWKQAHGDRSVSPVPQYLACFPYLINCAEWIHEKMTHILKPYCIVFSSFYLYN
ncbi:hypothetical protein GOP47_0023152 [Adiantum capillus-veneris]|uniref:Uncharacterized protein n=1 Tax=Adiantum capillus-veneris TaxID=13818 RepID=A0A9D4U7U9_ADICA|nr:hypothetical protein GOP47_0023152 [Adiantum capillus-veneris]